MVTGMIINEDTWNKIPAEQRDWILYTTLMDIDSRLRRLEGKKILDKTLTFMGGVVGGIAGLFTIKIFHNP